MTRPELLAFGAAVLVVGVAAGAGVRSWAQVEAWLLTRHSRKVRLYNSAHSHKSPAVTTVLDWDEWIARNARRPIEGEQP